MDILSNVAIWKEYGLPGLVIGFMFAAFFFFGRSVLKRNEASDRERTELLKEVMQSHSEERDQWRRDATLVQNEHRAEVRSLVDRTLSAVEDNTVAMQELKNEIGKFAVRG